MKTILLFTVISIIHIHVFSQNVGIGIANPVFKLDVRNGSINVDSVYRIGTTTVLSVLGTGNLFVGKDAGKINTGIHNTFNGDLAGFNNTTGRYNSFFGASAGYDNLEGEHNSFFGRAAGLFNTAGHYNSFFGRSAGYSNMTGTLNTALGYFSNVSTGALTNATAIGANARVDCSNCMVLGSVNGINGATSGVKVGIGVASPLARFHVADSSVLFSAPGDNPPTPGPLPIEGTGRRMMWYPDKAAFRVGFVNGAQWDLANIGNYSFASGISTKASDYASMATGDQTTASNYASTAMGFQTTASGDISIAMGNGTIASGDHSTSMGIGSNASGYTSFATGNFTDALGNNSTAMGSQTEASGENSTALGYYTIASGWSSIALGTNTNASGASSIAMGSNTFAVGANTTAIGTDAQANAEFSVVIGETVVANSWNSISLGRQNNPITTSPTTNWILTEPLLIVGNGTGPSDKKNALVILKNGNMGIGTNNPTRPLSFPAVTGTKISLYPGNNGDYGFGVHPSELRLHSDNVSADITFGYDDFTLGFTERMRIKGNGNIGIGTVDPVYRLDITGRMRIRSGGDVTTSAGLWLNNNANTASPAFFGMLTDDQVGLYGSAGWQFRMSASTGNVAIGNGDPTEKLTVHGNVCYTGAIGGCSDLRYKTNLSPLSNSLNKVLQMNGFYYFWKRDAYPEKDFSDKRQIGFSAQELEELFPEIVLTDAKGYKSVDYSRMTPVLVEAIKEQQIQIDQQQEQIDAFLYRDKKQQHQIDQQQIQNDQQQNEFDELKKLVKQLVAKN